MWAVVCGSVGRAVASDTRSAVRIQSSAKFIEHLFAVNCIEKTKIKKTEAGNGPFKKRSRRTTTQVIIGPHWLSTTINNKNTKPKTLKLGDKKTIGQ